jgi:hypothetical protein
MASSKFNEQDRKIIIKEIERIRDESLSRVGRFRKLLRSKGRKYYCIVGGKGNWHGITDSIFERIDREAHQSFLVVVLKKAGYYKIYMGRFAPMKNNSSELLHSEQDVYQFHVDEDGDRICVREVEGYCLELESVIDTRGNPYTMQSNENLKENKEDKKDKLFKEFEKLTKEKQQLVIDKLEEKINRDSGSS